MGTFKVTRRRPQKKSRPQRSELSGATSEMELLRVAAAKYEELSQLRRISEAAYFRAEHRGFEPGHELEDWLAAEAETVGSELLRVSTPAS